MSQRQRHILRLAVPLRFAQPTCVSAPPTTRVALDSDFCRLPPARTARPGSVTLS